MVKIMSKVRVTRNDLNNAYADWYKVKLGYCELQEILDFFEPMYYTTGTYGWNFDGYVFDGYLLTTGYRGMLGKRPKHSDIEYYKEDSKRWIEKWRKDLISTHELKNHLHENMYCLCYRTFEDERNAKNN